MCNPRSELQLVKNRQSAIYDWNPSCTHDVIMLIKYSCFPFKVFGFNEMDKFGKCLITQLIDASVLHSKQRPFYDEF